MNGWRHVLGAPRLAPLAGILVGALGGAVYWLAVQLWPTSLAVMLSMAATTLATRAHNESCLAEIVAASDPIPAPESHRLTVGMLALLFLILIKYTALMGLSAANLPIAVPPNVALGLIMIAGHAASRALKVSATAAHGGDLALALALGFAPAVLLGIPGLVGLVIAILQRMALGAWTKRHGGAATPGYFGTTQQLTEICFYLGALAAWTYV
jgi:adenosylcobinamide-GDP ribazoletransferase